MGANTTYTCGEVGTKVSHMSAILIHVANLHDIESSMLWTRQRKAWACSCRESRCRIICES